MKTYSVSIIFLFFFISGLFSQSGLIIRPGGRITVNGNLNVALCAVEAPAPGIHVPSATQIFWNWTAVSNAEGYKWNTVNDYATATDLGTATSKTESGLTCNTVYTRYLWAYRACGTSAFLVLNQSTSACPGICGSTLTDSRDGNVYATVQIGTQCWMAQNLNVGTRVNGSAYQYNNEIIEKHCYENLESNCSLYGGLYEWGEMVQYLNGASNTAAWYPAPTGNVQGICPSGWHIPTQAEWQVLRTWLGGYDVAGGKLKEAGTSHWLSPNTGASNESLFTALPAGAYDYNVQFFFGLGGYTYLWTATPWESYVTYAYFGKLAYNVGTFDVENVYGKSSSLSVRCVKD